jgi:hypothetical protein
VFIVPVLLQCFTASASLASSAEYDKTLQTAVKHAHHNNPAELQHARETLKDILAGMQTKPSLSDKIWLKVQAFLQKIAESIGKVIERIANAVGKTFGGVSLPKGFLDFLPTLIKIILALILVAIISGIVWWLVNKYTGSAKDEQEDWYSKKQSKPVRNTVDAIFRTAEMDAAQGRYREAFRGVYLASILLLDRASLLNYMESTTNWEYLRILKKQASPDTVEVFSGMTAMFDQFIYGKRSVSDPDYQSAVKSFRRLEEMV